MFKEKENKIRLFSLLASITLVLCIPFVFDIKVWDSENVEHIGFPFDWLSIFPSGGYSFKGLGFLLDVVLFYLLITFVINRLKKNNKKE